MPCPTNYGLDHARSSGDGDGSYADPKGPSATCEMLGFFFGMREDAQAGVTPEAQPAPTPVRPSRRAGQPDLRTLKLSPSPRLPT
jgi:hypothetical protein